jgi:hypothetical protein
MADFLEVGDTVEVISDCAFTGEVGRIVRNRSRSRGIHTVRFPSGEVQVFTRHELRRSQQKLDLREETA